MFGKRRLHYGGFGVWMLIGLLFLAAYCRAEMHIFTSPNGQAIEAKIVGYDERAGLVQVERKDGKRVKVKPSIFVEDDQRYIRNWVRSQAVLSKRSLRIESTERTVKEWKEEESMDVTYSNGSTEKDFIYNEIEFESVVYDFTFKNGTRSTITDLVLEYCIYYEQSGTTWQKKPEPQIKTRYGKTKIAVIKADEPLTISTEPVMIYEDSLNMLPQAGGDQRRAGEGAMIGVHARIKLEVDGEEVSREWSYPKSLDQEKYPWVETTSPNEHAHFKDLFGVHQGQE